MRGVHKCIEENIVYDKNNVKLYKKVQSGFICSECNIFIRGHPAVTTPTQELCYECGVKLGLCSIKEKHRINSEKEQFFKEKLTNGLNEDEIKLLWRHKLGKSSDNIERLRNIQLLGQKYMKQGLTRREAFIMAHKEINN